MTAESGPTQEVLDAFWETAFPPSVLRGRDRLMAPSGSGWTASAFRQV